MFKNITISNNEKLTLINNLSTLLSAGIPILESIDAILTDSKNNQKKLLKTIREDLIQGQHLYISLSKFPAVFNQITVNIIKASEETGNLEKALKDLARNIKKEMEFNDKIKSALVYPLFIFIVFICVLIVLLTFVIPKISTVFTRLRVKLPIQTRLLVFISNTLLKHPLYVIIGTIVLFVILFFMYKKNKKTFLYYISSLPIITNLTKEIDLTRFSHNLFLLLTAGIPITTALELNHNIVINKNINKIIAKSKEIILSGKKLSEGLKDEKKSIPIIMIKIIEAGEKSGTLDRSMQEIAEHFDYQVSKRLQLMTALIEPIMLIIVGVLIGGMMFSIIGPIYNLIGQIGSR